MRIILKSHAAQYAKAIEIARPTNLSSGTMFKGVKRRKDDEALIEIQRGKCAWPRDEPEVWRFLGCTLGFAGQVQREKYLVSSPWRSRRRLWAIIQRIKIPLSTQAD